MKKYWFYLEPYTFIFKGKQGCVVYNSLNGMTVNIDNKQEEVLLLIDKFENESNGYCFQITNEQIVNENISRFILEIKNTFSGDLLDCEMSNGKPFIFKPVLNLLDDHSRLNENNKSYTNQEGLSYLHEVSIYINSGCEQECKYCDFYHKQILFCAKNIGDQRLDLKDYQLIFSQLSAIGLKKVNILGGDLFHISWFYEIIDILQTYNIKPVLYIHYKNLDKTEVLIIREKISNIIVLVDEICDIGEKDQFKDPAYEWQFMVKTELEFYCVDKFIIANKLSARIIPFFTKSNESFFRKYVYLNIEDILDMPVSKQKIFSRQVLNENFFGKITIMPDGYVYSNVNMKPIGNLKISSLNELVSMEISQGKSWFLTRTEGVCADCVYKLLCPSLSNYELIMKKYNMCNIKKEYF